MLLDGFAGERILAVGTWLEGQSDVVPRDGNALFDTDFVDVEEETLVLRGCENVSKGLCMVWGWSSSAYRPSA